MMMIAVVMILLSIIQACYQPSVQSSVPLLVDKEALVQANGLVVQVNALSTLLGPILGGRLYAILSFPTLLWISAAAFFFSAIIECIMKIPFDKKERSHSRLSTSLHDLKEGMQFITKTKPQLFRLLLILAILNLVLSSLMSVGLPVISNITLGLPAQYYGWLEASLAIGSIIGSILLTTCFKRKTIKASYQFLLLASFGIGLIAVALLFQHTVYVSYAMVLFASVFSMMFAAMFNILAQTFLQQQTPDHLLGKVSSFVTMIVMCSYPIGQAIYGYLFDTFASFLPFIAFIACILSLLISIKTKRALADVEEM